MALPSEMPRADSEPEVRELTARALFLGGLLAAAFCAGNAYLGLFAGMTVSASIPAAIVSIAVLRLLGRGTILENNVVQTAASCGVSVASGAIFTFPALVILGDHRPLPYLSTAIYCFAGGAIGALLGIFLRRSYISSEALPFPEGLACAKVLHAGDGANAAPLAWGALLSAAIKATQDVLRLVPSVITGGRWLGDAAVAGSANLSPALAGIGFIVGPRIASSVFAGGVCAWLIAIPFTSIFHPELRSSTAAEAAYRLWSGQIRYLGVGAMVAGGLATLWRLRSAIARSLMDSFSAARLRALAAVREERDLAFTTILLALSVCLGAIFVLCYLLTGRLFLSAALALALGAIGLLVSAVAGYLAGIVGASNNPVSGMTIIVLLFISTLLMLAGSDFLSGRAVAITVGAVACTTAAMAGNSLHDLAIGFHVRSTPRALEIALLLGAGVSALTIAPVLNLLISGYGIAGTPQAGAHALAAPQAFVMAKVVQGVFEGDLPARTIIIGALFAAAVVGLDWRLERRGSRWRAPVMPVAIGLYLPFGVSSAIFVGSMARLAMRGEKTDEDTRGLLVASGLVAGEALMGIATLALAALGIGR